MFSTNATFKDMSKWHAGEGNCTVEFKGINHFFKLRMIDVCKSAQSETLQLKDSKEIKGWCSNLKFLFDWRRFEVLMSSSGLDYANFF